jgi:hypothetical protein
MGSMKRPPRRAHEISIDRIVLPPGTVGTRRVRAAVERELTRLLAAEPAAGDASVPALDLRVAIGADPDAIGVAIARQLHTGHAKRGT